MIGLVRQRGVYIFEQCEIAVDYPFTDNDVCTHTMPYTAYLHIHYYNYYSRDA
uniref:Uncharacterized protein n=1 Tax=Anguilla anguilla TaxID=7936 RepID=A0A0E9UTK8_ANGAN